MFTYQLTVQLHHTDAYGIIFFANQFKFCHDTFQAWLDQEGFPLPPNRQAAKELLVVVHAESDYQAPVNLGDRLTVHYQVEKIGTTSVTNRFTLTNQRGEQVGRVRTVHVLTDAATSTKLALTPRWKRNLAG
jgi:1,4-dihydroxy-2-naphthoyl-CoA hydrolase